LARQLVENVLNLLESDDPKEMPHDLEHESGGYRRLNQKTRNARVATLFGSVELWRYSYRYWHRDVAEACIFPLEIELGLVHGATPALAEAVARYMAQAGATQQAVLERLRSQHGVSWGAQRLRDVTEELSLAFADVTPECQVLRLLELLERAEQSRGPRRPVLSVGRDGVTLREYRFRFFEHATVGTVAVYDRTGKRLGTVYLAFAPEAGQTQMTTRLTALIREVLRRWKGSLPRLAFLDTTQVGLEVLAELIAWEWSGGEDASTEFPGRRGGSTLDSHLKCPQVASGLLVCRGRGGMHVYAMMPVWKPRSGSRSAADKAWDTVPAGRIG
jgi:hypothetical protein